MKPIVRDANLSQAFQTGWQLYKENFGFILGVSLVAGLVAGFTCGICAGPMTCGVYAILLALLRSREPKPQFGDLFHEGFARFAPSFVTLLAIVGASSVVNLVLCIVPIAGSLASFALSFIMGGIASWAMLLVTDQGASIGDAISLPIKNLQDNRFWTFVLIVFLGGLAASAGLLLCLVGILFTAPFAQCVTVAAYEQMTGAGAPSPAPAAPLPPPPPPASDPPPPAPEEEPPPPSATGA